MLASLRRLRVDASTRAQSKDATVPGMGRLGWRVAILDKPAPAPMVVRLNVVHMHVTQGRNRQRQQRWRWRERVISIDICRVDDQGGAQQFGLGIAWMLIAQRVARSLQLWSPIRMTVTRPARSTVAIIAITPTPPLASA